MYALLFSRHSVRQLTRMPPQVAKRIRDRLDQLAQDPYARQANVRPLVGRPGYRLRVGDWRVLYSIDNDLLRIVVLDIARRDEVYR